MSIVKDYQKPEALILSFEVEETLMSGPDGEDSGFDTSGMGGSSTAPFSFD